MNQTPSLAAVIGTAIGLILMIAAPASAQNLSEKGSDPLRRGAPPKGQTPFRIGSQSPNGENPVLTDKALRKLYGNPWYDESTGGYRPPVYRPLPDDVIRREGWVATPKNPTPARPAAKRGWSGLNASEFAYTVVSILGVVLLCGILTMIYHYYGFGGTPAKALIKSRMRIDPARVTDLPFDVTLVRDDPLAEAQAHMQANRYQDAIVYLYGYMLLALDQARKIQLQKGKTNRMYLQELRSATIPMATDPANTSRDIRPADRTLVEILQLTMQAFEDVYFGRHPIEKSRLDQLWSRMTEFHALLSDSAPVSAKKVSLA